LLGHGEKLKESSDVIRIVTGMIRWTKNRMEMEYERKVE
jgi:hypothetical protein